MISFLFGGFLANFYWFEQLSLAISLSLPDWLAKMLAFSYMEDFFSRAKKMVDFRSAAMADPEIAAWGKTVTSTVGSVLL